jgi:murein L,D-transpeptidase YcbB/YkuD
MMLRPLQIRSFATLRFHTQWRRALPIVVLACLSAFPSLSVAQSSARIESLVEAGTLDGMRWPSFRHYQQNLRELYASISYAPVWIQGTVLSPQALSMIQLFHDAWKKGLEPEDYDASRWDGRQQALQRSNAEAAEMDVALTVSAIRYISDLRVGRINPRQVAFDLTVEQKKYDLAHFLRERLLSAPNIPSVLESIEPPFIGYRRTQEALIHYVELARVDDGEQLPVPVKPIEHGQSYPGLARLVRLLRLVGDLPPEPVQPIVPQHYDDTLVDAVKRFQRRHGLDDDGRIGAATVKQLNVPLTDRVRQLKLTLERWRWLPTEFSSPPIVVNIPDFRLRALAPDNSVSMDMRVVVGKAMRTETPVFSREMRYVVFRPYWVVPASIVHHQIIPALKRDRNYLAKHRYEVTTHNGTVITSGAISNAVLAQLQTGKLTVRQKSGPKNSLGLVKLIFPNEHHVYLHSTPSTELFSRARRDFSHGCIRVQQPAALAAWALRNNPGWTLERVEQAMQSGHDNVTVNLAERIPVFIIYGTALAYGNDEVHFYDDLYGHDAKLARAFSQGYAHP